MTCYAYSPCHSFISLYSPALIYSLACGAPCRLLRRVCVWTSTSKWGWMVGCFWSCPSPPFSRHRHTAYTHASLSHSSLSTTARNSLRFCVTPSQQDEKALELLYWRIVAERTDTLRLKVCPGLRCYCNCFSTLFVVLIVGKPGLEVQVWGNEITECDWMIFVFTFDNSVPCFPPLVPPFPAIFFPLSPPLSSCRAEPSWSTTGSCPAQLPDRQKKTKNRTTFPHKITSIILISSGIFLFLIFIPHTERSIEAEVHNTTHPTWRTAIVFCRTKQGKRRTLRTTYTVQTSEERQTSTVSLAPRFLAFFVVVFVVDWRRDTLNALGAFLRTERERRPLTTQQPAVTKPATRGCL